MPSRIFKIQRITLWLKTVIRFMWTLAFLICATFKEKPFNTTHWDCLLRGLQEPSALKWLELCGIRNIMVRQLVSHCPVFRVFQEERHVYISAKKPLIHSLRQLLMMLEALVKLIQMLQNRFRWRSRSSKIWCLVSLMSLKKKMRSISAPISIKS